VHGVPRATIAVLGLGGIGGLLAARTGALCVGTERTVAAIRARGLRLEHADEVTVVRPEVVDRLEYPVSLLVIAVKAYDLGAALDRVAPAALEGALVLPLLNGLDTPAVLRARFHRASYSLLQARPAVAAGSIGNMSAHAPEPGVVVQGTAPPGRITVASRDLGRKRLAAVLAPLAVPGIDVVELDDEAEVLWEKAARLAVLAAATVASGLTFGALRDDPAWRERLHGALDEAVAVATADGVRLSAPDQWAKIASMPAELTTSAARDAAAGRPTELDAITGSVVRAGTRLGVPTPVLQELLEEARCRAR
jgi:2-dehydropantoate 2-reductase